MPKTKGTKRGAEAAADASAKKGRRASEADVALRLGDELGEHTIVSLANIILLKIAADLGCGDTIDHMAVVKNYLCLFVALCFIAKTFTENLITGTHASSKSSISCGAAPAAESILFATRKKRALTQASEKSVPNFSHDAR